jgi:hypothetical protein
MDRRIRVVRSDRMAGRRVMLVALLAAAMTLPLSGGQEKYLRGQNVAPIFDGWEENPDGSFNMVFGYLNRNYEEVVDVPVGADNKFEPGGNDQGQPTRFFPRRSRFLFRVKVPKDFGNKELVWTLTTHGRTDKAYATLRPEYILDNALIEGGNIGQRKERNEAPVINVEGSDHRATVGRPMTLTAHITDDGIPKAPPPGGIETRRARFGLRAGWFVYRGMGTIAFDPPQSQPFKRDSAAFVPADGHSSVKVTFSQAGRYVLRVTADDGGLFSVRDLTVTVE